MQTQTRQVRRPRRIFIRGRVQGVPSRLRQGRRVGRYGRSSHLGHPRQHALHARTYCRRCGRRVRGVGLTARARSYNRCARPHRAAAPAQWPLTRCRTPRRGCHVRAGCSSRRSPRPVWPLPHAEARGHVTSRTTANLPAGRDPRRVASNSRISFLLSTNLGYGGSRSPGVYCQYLDNQVVSLERHLGLT